VDGSEIDGEARNTHILRTLECICAAENRVITMNKAKSTSGNTTIASGSQRRGKQILLTILALATTFSPT
jgi:hypothetical protein